MNIGIIKKDNIDANPLLNVLASFSFRYEILKENSKFIPNLIISYGGDGTILYAMQFAVKFNIPLYAISAGNLNFLASGNVEDLEIQLKTLDINDWEFINRSLIEVNFENNKKLALNDIVISSSKPANMVEINMKIDNQFITSYKADGLLISTSTGSTAYNLSVGGSIIEPNLDILNISPISPQSFQHKSLIINKNHIISLYSNDDITITLDGNKREKTKNIEVKISKKELKLISPKNKSYFEILTEKFNWNN